MKIFSTKIIYNLVQDLVAETLQFQGWKAIWFKTANMYAA